MTEPVCVCETRQGAWTKSQHPSEALICNQEKGKLSEEGQWNEEDTGRGCEWTWAVFVKCGHIEAVSCYGETEPPETERLRQNTPVISLLPLPEPLAQHTTHSNSKIILQAIGK